MQKLITKYGLAAHLAFLAVAPLFLSPVCVLWLSLLGVTWLIMEPSRVGGEMLHDARHRVFRAAVRDPLSWVLLAVIGFAAVRLLNVGVKMDYDLESGSWLLREATVPWCPGSTESEGGPEFAVSVALFVVVMGCRLALGKSARQAFLVLLSVLTGVFGLTLSYLHYDGSAVMREMAAFNAAVPMHVGMFFGLGLLTTMVAMTASFEHVWRASILLLMPALAGNVAGLLIFAPAWTVAVFFAAASLLFVFCFVYAKCTMGGNNEFKYLVVFGIGLLLAGSVAVGVVSKGPLLAKLDAVKAGKPFPESYSSVRATMSAVSRRVWKAHPWIGTGLGSFDPAITISATEQEWETIPRKTNRLDRRCAPNGYWHLLVERGIVGAFVLLCPLSLLLYTYFQRLAVGVRCRLPSPSAWVGLVSLAAVLVLTAADSSFFYPGVTLLTAAVLAVSANSFPKEKVNG